MPNSTLLGPGRLLRPRVPWNQVSPTFRPSLRLRRQSILSRNVILCWVDRGNGRYTNVCGGYEVLPGNPGSTAGRPASVASKGSVYGGGTHWPGISTGFASPGWAAICYGTGDQNPYIGDPRIYNAANLSNLAAGCGNTFWCTYIKLAAVINADYEWIWGQTGISAGEGSPFALWGFADGIAPTADGTVAACWTSQSGSFGAQQTMGAFTVSIGVLSTFVMSSINTSAGVCTSQFYANGVLNATTTGTSMWMPNVGTVSEIQPQLSNTYHFDTGNTKETTESIIGIAGFSATPWSASAAMYFNKHPFDMLERG